MKQKNGGCWQNVLKKGIEGIDCFVILRNFSLIENHLGNQLRISWFQF